MTTAKTRAEMQIAANERQTKRDAAHELQAKRAQAEHEIALQERAEQIAKLRALRLAKEGDARGQGRKSDDTREIDGGDTP